MGYKRLFKKGRKKMKEIIGIVWKDKTITYKKENKGVTNSVDEFIYNSLKNQIVRSERTKTK